MSQFFNVRTLQQKDEGCRFWNNVRNKIALRKLIALLAEVMITQGVQTLLSAWAGMRCKGVRRVSHIC